MSSHQTSSVMLAILLSLFSSAGLSQVTCLNQSVAYSSTQSTPVSLTRLPRPVNTQIAEAINCLNTHSHSNDTVYLSPGEWYQCNAKYCFGELVNCLHPSLIDLKNPHPHGKPLTDAQIRTANFIFTADAFTAWESLGYKYNDGNGGVIDMNEQNQLLQCGCQGEIKFCNAPTPPKTRGKRDSFQDDMINWVSAHDDDGLERRPHSHHATTSTPSCSSNTSSTVAAPSTTSNNVGAQSAKSSSKSSMSILTTVHSTAATKSTTSAQVQHSSDSTPKSDSNSGFPAFITTHSTVTTTTTTTPSPTQNASSVTSERVLPISYSFYEPSGASTIVRNGVTMVTFLSVSTPESSSSHRSSSKA